ncbi:Uncharacterized protein FKW44_005266 [Caligus rogercresseyi]|uniref:Uncharacterized protein n=1 Tax=Caligus rogercresseyi TaxID=217165 RepID=A0A7T8KBR1_CALRO|nr:Uncharacterized protein FKW44_005266 [Caligus rogercresseyi]
MSFRSLIPPIFQRWCLDPSSKSPSQGSIEEGLQEQLAPVTHGGAATCPMYAPSPHTSQNRERHLLEEVLIRNFENRVHGGPRRAKSTSDTPAPWRNEIHRPVLAFSSKERISKDEARQRMISWRRTTRIRKKSTYSFSNEP